MIGGQKFAFLSALFPFLRWFPMRAETLRADLIAGLTVSMVLIPQALAYPQLAGMPALHGLYAAFLPVMVAALWGSSNQMSSGPVVVASLLTASALGGLALPGSADYVSLAIVLALMVGVIQITMATFRMGQIVSFLSHPVVVGFINAAALIISLSQINKLLGVPIDSSGWLLRDVAGVLSQIAETHGVTLLIGLTSLVGILALKRFWPKLPGVMVVAVLMTILSWAISFENVTTVRVERIAPPEVRELVDGVERARQQVHEINTRIGDKSVAYREAAKHKGREDPATAALKFEIELLRLEGANFEKQIQSSLKRLRLFVFERVTTGAGEQFHFAGALPVDAHGDGGRWRIRRVANGELRLSGGGEVVGAIPAGLPEFKLPQLSWERFATLITSAFILAIIAFTAVISGARALATKTKQRLNPNQELFGQGLANVVGSVTSCYPIGGALARSAVNLSAGARTGMASVFAGLTVMVLLLFFTSLLYHMPQAVLSAILITAVISLVDIEAMKFAWKSHRHDGIAALATFSGTVLFAPSLDRGILIGAGIAIVLYLYRSMKPRVVLLARHPDGTLRDARLHQLPVSEHIIALRYDGSLYFANVPYFEDAILDASARKPKAKFILIVGDSINEIDASGQATVRHLVERLQVGGVTMVFSGLKQQVVHAIQATGLYGVIGAQNLFRTEALALEAIYQRIHDASFDAKFCPLKPPDLSQRSREIGV